MQVERIVILTGAGISAESGIKTFRDSGGLWENHFIEDVATPEGFVRNPGLVQRFYNDRRRQLQDPSIQPNAAHRGLSELEERHSGQVLVVTQNVDNLHERAGTKNLIHMHGQLLQMRCQRTGQVFPVTGDISPDLRCACCSRTATLRPNIVWFHEMPFEMDRIFGELSRCDLFMAIGTSGNVYPAAGFVHAANRAGAHTVELNLEPSLVESEFQEKLYGKAGEVVPAFVKKLLDSA